MEPRLLVDLDPRWIKDKDGRIHGVNFRCPIHTTIPDNPEFTCRHSVGFTNPPDGGPQQAYWRTTWHRRGETFETLQLDPSIRCLGFQDGGGCRWHGYVGLAVPGLVTTLGDSR